MTYFCSFCGKSQHKIIKMVRQGDSIICNECVADCVAIMLNPEKDDLIKRLDKWSAASTTSGKI